MPNGAVADNGNTATVIVRFISANTSVLTVTLGSETKSVPAGSGTVTYTRTGVSDLPVFLKDKGVEIATGVSKASCSANAARDTAWNICREITHHKDVVVGIWDKNGDQPDPACPDWDTWARVSGGLFFGDATGLGNPSTNRKHRRYQPNGGLARELQSWTVAESANLKIMRAFNCAP